MTMGAKAGGHEAPLAEINVTPLVDVLLVMLAIFLVVAPLMTKALHVELPKADAQASVPHEHAVTVSIDSGNRVFVDGRQIEAGKLEPLLAHLVAHDPKTSVSLRSDRRESFDNVASVLAAIGRAGITHVAVVTEPGSSHRN